MSSIIEVTKDLEKTNSSLRDKSFEKEDEEERLKSENTALTERVRELERAVVRREQQLLSFIS